MSYDRGAMTRVTVEKALRKIGGSANYEPAENLHDLLVDSLELCDNLTNYEILEALRQNEPALYVATVEMLVMLYVETVEKDACDCPPGDPKCDACRNEDDGEIRFN